MNKKKVKTLHSMMLKIVCLFSLGVILMSATLILISLPRSQDMTKTLVQNYMMSSVKSNGYIIDTLMAVNGKNILQSPDTMSKILSGVKIEGNESSYAYLVSADGTMLYHPDSDKIGKTGRAIVKLPSTSPANAGYSLERLCELWRKALALK